MANMFKRYDTCNNCGSDRIQLLDLVIQGDMVRAILLCEHCGNKFYEIFTFSHTEFSEMEGSKND